MTNSHEQTTPPGLGRRAWRVGVLVAALAACSPADPIATTLLAGGTSFVAAVTVTPATTSLVVGATQQLTTVVRDSSGQGLVGKTIVYASGSNSIATVTATGLVTAVGVGNTTISVTVNGITASASVTVTAAPVTPPPPPSNPPPTTAGTIADPSALPLATGQPPNVTAYNSLNVLNNVASGSFYIDPTTGRTVWRISSASKPIANTGASHDYADGAVQVSRAWGSKLQHTVLVRVDNNGYYLVDFTPSSQSGAGLSNWRKLPAGAQPASDLCFTFSNVVSTPQIAYIFTGTQIVRFNTATNLVENTGLFPKTLAAGPWLQTDKNDKWFVKLIGSAAAVAWNSQTGQTIQQNRPTLNEPRLAKEGDVVVLADQPAFAMWDLTTNTVGPTISDPNRPFAHNASMRKLFVATNWNANAPWYHYQVNPNGSTVALPGPASGTNTHLSGSWIQEDADLTPAGNLQKQWFVASTYSTPAGFVGALYDAIGFFRADVSEKRILAHAYSLGNSYWAYPKATSSPDGRVVIFDSNMYVSGGRNDLFLVEVPTK